MTRVWCRGEAGQAHAQMPHDTAQHSCDTDNADDMGPLLMTRVWCRGEAGQARLSAQVAPGVAALLSATMAVILRGLHAYYPYTFTCEAIYCANDKVIITGYHLFRERLVTATVVHGQTCIRGLSIAGMKHSGPYS
jgi:hypothetical protein